MLVLVVLAVYAGAYFVDVVTNNVEEDRAPALLIALAVLGALAAVAALGVVVKRLRGWLNPGWFSAGAILTATSVLSTFLLTVVGLSATGHS